MPFKATNWDPTSYSRFIDVRTRPAKDILAHLSGLTPRIIYDLGCGYGNITNVIKEQWPKANVIGIDASPDMIRSAKMDYPELSFIQQNINNWVPDLQPDLIFANSLFHLIEEHDGLFLKLIKFLKPGGILAIQMPFAYREPWYTLMKSTLKQGIIEKRISNQDSLLDAINLENVKSSEHYFSLLSPLTSDLNIWETRYLMELEGDNPVYSWVEGAGLKVIQSNLTASEYEYFTEQYRKKVKELYPPVYNDCTLFPFLRTFVIAEK